MSELVTVPWQYANRSLWRSRATPAQAYHRVCVSSHLLLRFTVVCDFSPVSKPCFSGFNGLYLPQRVPFPACPGCRLREPYWDGPMLELFLAVQICSRHYRGAMRIAPSMRMVSPLR